MAKIETAPIMSPMMCFILFSFGRIEGAEAPVGSRLASQSKFLNCAIERGRCYIKAAWRGFDWAYPSEAVLAFCDANRNAEVFANHVCGLGGFKIEVLC